MSLLDELRGIEHFPPSHEPVTGDVLEVVGKLVAYVEHGDQLLQAADKDAQARKAGQPAYNVNDLLAPPSEDELAARTVGQAPTPADVAKDAEIAQLRQELATAQAQAQRTTATVEAVPDAPAVPPGPAPAAPLQPVEPPSNPTQGG